MSAHRRRRALVLATATALPFSRISISSADDHTKVYSGTECRSTNVRGSDFALDTHGSGGVLKNTDTGGITGSFTGIECPIVHEQVFDSGMVSLRNDVFVFLHMTYNGMYDYKPCTLYSRVLGSTTFVSMNTEPQVGGGNALYSMLLPDAPAGYSSRAVLCWLPPGQSVYGYEVVTDGHQ